MPTREIPLINGEYYHVFNRTYQYDPFSDKRLCDRAKFALWYSNYTHPLSVSRYLCSAKETQEKFIVKAKSLTPKVDIISFCFMPNHFHLLLKQNKDEGISKFLSDFQNCLTQYFNKKNHLLGPLFQRQFKSVLIPNQEVFTHVSRYIHLNPYTAKLVHSGEELISFENSSLPIYLGLQDDPHQTINQTPLMNCFKSPQEYKAFILNHADHQRSLHIYHKEYVDG